MSTFVAQMLGVFVGLVATYGFWRLVDKLQDWRARKRLGAARERSRQSLAQFTEFVESTGPFVRVQRREEWS